LFDEIKGNDFDQTAHQNRDHGQHGKRQGLGFEPAVSPRVLGFMACFVLGERHGLSLLIWFKLSALGWVELDDAEQALLGVELISVFNPKNIRKP
jgi:hypothetical protein